MGRGRWPTEVKKLGGLPWNAQTARSIEEMFEALKAGMVDVQRTPDLPTQIQAGVAAARGDGPAIANDDHVHNIETGAPSNPTGQNASEGAGSALMRATAVIKQGIVTTKGDLLTHHATLPERLAVGADKRLLMADSAGARGLRWAGQSALTAA